MREIVSKKKAKYIILRGVLGWGALTALLITLFNWYPAHRFESAHSIALRFLIFMVGGIWFGSSSWNRRETVGCKELSRTGNIVRLVVFAGLMIGLGYILWSMIRR